ncbi:SDR family NAD(P)-dependent oxidoreductase [Sinimarinibacterium sp. CAU 1509]|uniref:SDR family NAD(P)-dependent oxidoreductase n=1 Tax=Sinimarinibacterium sp. CAU 1509 TaxID=2562283 RepID=UPI0010AC60C8|nr:SDR family NAD(P)-dependent oxidoreductase [Sinimarinibacterium sp. CAU 1509]TJY58911.1 SDR family NAD(P)-dependent oxidoreductase [Sinimarinibacterium sp. CAU 1509]
MKHALITGGASGLGFGCATRFVRLGFDVTLVDINQNTGASALSQLKAMAGNGQRCRFETVDLADPDSIVALAQRLIVAGDPIDVLVNNAGIYPPSIRTLSKEGHELTFAIAHLGHFRLTHALWPLLDKAEAARVISISSMVQRQAKSNFDDMTFEKHYMPILAYQQAKLSCLLFALELQRKLGASGSKIGSYAAHPGVCRTQLSHNRKLSDQDNAWQRLSSFFLRGLRYVGQSPENGAGSVVMAATSQSIPRGAFIGPTGPLEAFGRPGVVKPSPVASDPQIAAELWQRTEALTGLRWPFG